MGTNFLPDILASESHPPCPTSVYREGHFGVALGEARTLRTATKEHREHRIERQKLTKCEDRRVPRVLSRHVTVPSHNTDSPYARGGGGGCARSIARARV